MVCGPGYEAMFTSSSMVDYKPRQGLPLRGTISMTVTCAGIHAE